MLKLRRESLMLLINLLRLSKYKLTYSVGWKNLEGQFSLLPVQFLPSPFKPSLQLQLKEPSVLLQSALTSQLWVLVIHSSTSKETNAFY